jgi:hypothetical protein
MKKVGLLVVLAATAVLLGCSAVSSAPTTVTSPANLFATGWNLFALPAIPTTPGPGAVFDEIGGDEGVDYRSLYRWDAPLQGLVRFDMWAPDDFGNLLLGDGYWIRFDPGDPNQVSFTGITDNDSTDMWISLPKAGWTIIGHPYSYPQPETAPGEPYYVGTPYLWDNVSVTDGTVTKSMYDACQYGANWLDSTAFWFDSSNQSLINLGLSDDFPQCDSLIAWHGYWVRTFRDNLALILDAAPPAP